METKSDNDTGLALLRLRVVHGEMVRTVSPAAMPSVWSAGETLRATDASVAQHSSYILLNPRRPTMKQPIHTIRFGLIKASIWRNHTKAATATS